MRSPWTIVPHLLLLAGLGIAAAACDRASTPPASQQARASATLSSPAKSTASALRPAVSASAAPTKDGPVPSASAQAAEVPELNLFDAAGNPLGQSKQEPSSASGLFKKHLAQLWDAIVHDEPERAFAFFFPVAAYAQVKGIKKPERDHKFRLLKAFKRDIHKYHRRLGKKPQQARFERLEIRNKPRWMKPGSEGNRIGYFRVTRSYLHYRNADGKKRRLDLTSMISWRGEWFVVHLHGFR